MTQVNLNIEQLDDAIFADGTPTFTGGQNSNERANLLQANESTSLVNADISKLGRLTTRQGSIRLGAAGVSTAGTIVQGLCNFYTDTFNYLVAAYNGKIYAFTSGIWTQIATGGVFDNDDIEILKNGLVNNAGGYAVGATTIVVDGFIGQGVVGDKFIFPTRDKTFEYTITVAGLTGTNLTSITIAAPGLVVPIFDNDPIALKRLGAKINNGGGYAGGTTVIAIDGITGILDNADSFVIKGEEVLHRITAHTETAGNTTGLTFAATPIQGAYASANTTNPIIFAKGVDKIFWSDGIGNIYGWDGSHTTNLASGNIYDGWDATVALLSQPPNTVTSMIWFQNRLIANGVVQTLEGKTFGITSKDAVYFSDFLDPLTWDREFQSLRVGGGEGDPIVALVAWSDLNMAVFKRNSIYVINLDPSQNATPEDPTALVGSYAIKLLVRATGCIAAQTAVQVGGPGGDIFFLSNSGVRSLRRTVAAATQQEIGDALSFPVQDVIDRINPMYAYRSVAVYRDNRYLIALPLDGAAYPNYVAVYNLLTQSWTGTWTGWLPTAFEIQTTVGLLPSLCFGQSDGTVFQWLDSSGLPEVLSSSAMPLTTPFGVAATNIITLAAHGLANGDPIQFTALTGGAGLSAGPVYYIISATTNTFQVSLTFGGAAVDFTTDITAGSVKQIVTYLDNDVAYPTQILTRAYTWGDLFAPKTGFQCEFEFTESAAFVNIQAILDRQNRGDVDSFITKSDPLLHVPWTIPITLATDPLLRVARDIQRFGQFREFQFFLATPSGKLSIRSIKATAFMDSLLVQSGVPAAVT